MAASPSPTDLLAVESLHQLPDEQYAQALLDAGLMKPLTAKQKSKAERPLGELLAERLQQKWIDDGLVKRALRLLPEGMVAWSAESLLPPVLDVSTEAEFLKTVDELTRLTSSPRSISPKKRVQLSKQLYDCLHFLGSSQSEFTPATPYQLLRVVEIFIKGGAIWSIAEFWEIYRWVATQFLHLLASRETLVGTNATPVQMLVLEGELPWLAGLLFGSADRFREYGESGQKTLRKALKKSLDNDGTPSASIIDFLAEWLAPLIRGHFWGKLFGQDVWKKKQVELYEDLLEHASLLCRPSGRLMLSAEGESNHAAMLESALRQSEFANNSKALKFVTNVASIPAASRNGLMVKSRRWGKVKKSISTQSDWAELALMRSNWALDADSIVVAHHEGAAPQIEMSALGERLFQGAWEVEVKIRGQKRKLTHEWECACWYSDKESDYLELALAITDEITVNRQIVLSRGDHFAMLVESSYPAGEQQVEISSRLPLATGVEATADQPTREWRLNVKKQAIRIFPLDEPQFKTYKTDGEMLIRDGMLEQRQSGIGGAINVLFLDWHPRRNRERVEWRNLTITENRRVVAPGEAFAARVRLKNRQWMFYRGLRSGWEWPRAVLGLHTNYETVLGHVSSTGDIEALVNVE
ncbi:MAG: hypothetical protein CMJ46_05495 [Planctomyces sp.]|nr:hypothetical protein [Planctomyces sp.]